MLSDLFPLLAALTTAAIIYVIRERRRRRAEIRPRAPELSMEQAWNLWVEASDAHPDRRFLIPSIARPDSLPEPLTAIVRSALFEIETAVHDAAQPRTAVRRAILDSARRAIHLERALELGDAERAALIQDYKAGMENLVRDAWRMHTAMWIVLRLYAHWKYDDAVEEDWFHNFLYLARPYIREKMRLAGEYVLKMESGAGRFAEVYDGLLDDLQSRMEKVHSKVRFVPPDIR